MKPIKVQGRTMFVLPLAEQDAAREAFYKAYMQGALTEDEFGARLNKPKANAPNL